MTEPIFVGRERELAREEAQAHTRALQGYLAEHGAGSLPIEAHLACAVVLAALGNPKAAREMLL